MNIAELLLPFCEAASLSLTCSETVLKHFIVSMAMADHKQVVRTLFGDSSTDAMDWNGVERYLSMCNFSADDWGRMLGLLDFTHEVCVPSDMLDLLSNAKAKVRVNLQNRTLDPLLSMRLCFAKAGQTPTWDTLCKALLACNLLGADVGRVLAHVVEPALANELLQQLPSCPRHTSEEYTRLYSWLLDAKKHVSVRAHLVEEGLKQLEQRREDQKLSVEVTHAATARVSLSRRLEQLRLRSGAPQDSFGTFCTRCHLPAGSNPRLVQLLYYLVCLPPGTADASLLNVVVPEVHIVTPDTLALRRFLQGSLYSGALCDELRDFLERCVTGLSRRDLSNTTVLRLYLATYCAPTLVRGLWDFVLSGAKQTQICNEADASIRTYLQSRPKLALQALLSVLLC